MIKANLWMNELFADAETFAALFARAASARNESLSRLGGDELEL